MKIKKTVIATMPSEVYHQIPQHLKDQIIDFKVSRDDYHLYKDLKEYKRYNKEKKIWDNFLYKLRNK